MPSSYNRAIGTIDAFATGTLTGVVAGADQGSKAEAINKIEAQIVKEAPLNVKWAEFGAVGDNANDDTGEIQAAVNAASAAGGGDVLLPRGTYRVSSAISVPNFVNLCGEGQSSVLRCTGNHYAINLNPANRATIKNIQIDAVSVQSSGGGIDFTNAASNIWLSDLYFGSNLHTSLNMKPAAQAGIWMIERMRWNGVTGCNTGFAIGDGTNLVTDVYISHVIGTAASITDMDTWVKVLKNVDTVHMTDCLFYSGSKGLVAGASGTGDVTNCKFTGLVFDNQDLEGVNVTSCRVMHFANCSVQGCGTTALPGIKVGASAKGFGWAGGHVHQCRSDGVSIANGSVDTLITDAHILNNNTSNQSFGSGVTVSSAASDFTITGCSIGNNLAGITANQKSGILMGGGASNNIVVTGNRFPGNVTNAYNTNSITGANVIWANNVPDVIPTVASATTTTLFPGDVVIVSGTTTITSVIAGHVGRRVTLIFSGVLTFTDGSNLKLNANYVTSADDTITLVSDGTNWFETGRSAN